LLLKVCLFGVVLAETKQIKTTRNYPKPQFR
jgi:hypothetical protein